MDISERVLQLSIVIVLAGLMGAAMFRPENSYFLALNALLGMVLGYFFHKAQVSKVARFPLNPEPPSGPEQAPAMQAEKIPSVLNP